MSHQSLEALIRANEVRLEQSQRKREIAKLPRPTGLRLVATILEYPSEAEARMRVGDLLCSIHRLGRVLSNRLLLSLGINAHRRLGPVANGEPQLTQAQRERLAKALRERA